LWEVVKSSINFPLGCIVAKTILGGYKLAKSKISKKHTLSVEGVLDLENDITIEVEGYGVLQLKDLLKDFDGANMKMIVNKTDNIT